MSSPWRKPDRSKRPLPPPNVVVPCADHKKWTAEHVRAIVCNPIYAGIPPYPATISDDMWIRVAVKAIEKEGPEQFLVNLLCVLRQTMQDTLGDDTPSALPPKRPLPPNPESN